MSTLLQDLRYGFRMPAKSPGFTAVAIITLALGIGANSAIFSFIDDAVLKPLPFPHPEQLVVVYEKSPAGEIAGISYPTYLDWQRESTSFQSMSLMAGTRNTLTGFGEPQQLIVQLVSANYFEVMGLGVTLGRNFVAGEDQQTGKEWVLILSNRTWRSRFGADPNISGRKVTVEGKTHTILGVLPAGRIYDRWWADVWMTAVYHPEMSANRSFRWLIGVARLKPGVTIENARAELESLAARTARDYPASNRGWSVALRPFADDFVDPELRRSLWVLGAAVGALLLIGSVNLANLMLARGTERDHEVAIRAALGAERNRILRQFLTENVMLALAGGAVGLAVGYLMMRAIQATMPRLTLPPQVDVHMDYRVLFFTFAVSLVTGIFFGMAPAVDAARRDVIGQIKEGSRTTPGALRHRLRGILIITEVALSFLLLMGAGLLIRSFVRLVSVDPGFETTNVITMGLPMIMDGKPENTDPVRVSNYLHQIRDQVQAVPGVREAAITQALPLQGWGYDMPFLIVGHPFVERSNRPSCFVKIISPSYFRAVGMRLIQGRGLVESDVKGAPPALVINETMKRRHFKGEDPLGKHILIQQILTGSHLFGPEIPWEVVGVVADEKVGSLNRDNAGVYISYDQNPEVVGMNLVVRSYGNPALLTSQIKLAVWKANKNQALAEVRTLEEIKSQSVGSNRFYTTLLVIFAGIALLLAGVGIYGVISYSVAQRTHEIVIRSALGAKTADLLRLVAGNAMLLAAIGLGLGAVASLGLTRLISSLLFNTSPTDFTTMIVVAALLEGVALAASYIPARRATKVDPMVALRHE